MLRREVTVRGLGREDVPAFAPRHSASALCAPAASLTTNLRHLHAQHMCRHMPLVVSLAVPTPSGKRDGVASHGQGRGRLRREGARHVRIARWPRQVRAGRRRVEIYFLAKRNRHSAPQKRRGNPWATAFFLCYRLIAEPLSVRRNCHAQKRQKQAAGPLGFTAGFLGQMASQVWPR
jgi:hypothetical protein